jgi:hypothetical protein
MRNTPIEKTNSTVSNVTHLGAGNLKMPLETFKNFFKEIVEGFYTDPPKRQLEPGNLLNACPSIKRLDAHLPQLLEAAMKNPNVKIEKTRSQEDSDQYRIDDNFLVSVKHGADPHDTKSITFIYSGAQGTSASLRDGLTISESFKWGHSSDPNWITGDAQWTTLRGQRYINSMNGFLFDSNIKIVDRFNAEFSSKGQLRSYTTTDANKPTACTPEN